MSLLSEVTAKCGANVEQFDEYALISLMGIFEFYRGGFDDILQKLIQILEDPDRNITMITDNEIMEVAFGNLQHSD